MLRMILVILGVAVITAALLGVRGQKTTNRPRHVFWDMKYQGKYTAQGRSAYFADGRSARLPVTGTVAFTGNNYFADAGYVSVGSPDFVKEDDIYYFGFKGEREVEIVEDLPKMGADGKPEMKDGKPVMEKKTRKEMQPAFTPNIPKRAVEEAGGWPALLARGQERYTITCAVCHGASGMGGQGDTAHGVVGRYGMIGIANYHDARIREMADGEIFNTITVGKNTMSPYGHMVKPQDRWAIVAYVRALQYSQMADKALIPAALRDEWGVK